MGKSAAKKKGKKHKASTDTKDGLKSVPSRSKTGGKEGKAGKKSRKKSAKAKAPQARVIPMETAGNSSQLSLAEAQKLVDQWIRSKGVRYFSELTNMAILTEEVGEVARLAARRFGDQSFKESQQHRNSQQEWADELADVLWVLMALANQTGVDLEVAFQHNMQKKSERDVDRHARNEKLRRIKDREYND